MARVTIAGTGCHLNLSSHLDLNDFLTPLIPVLRATGNFRWDEVTMSRFVLAECNGHL